MDISFSVHFSFTNFRTSPPSDQKILLFVLRKIFRLNFIRIDGKKKDKIYSFPVRPRKFCHSVQNSSCFHSPNHKRIGRAGEYPAEIFRDRSDVNPRSIFAHTRSRTRENRCETVTQKRRLQSTENPSQRETTLRRLRKNPSPGDMFGSTVTRKSSVWKTVPLL